MILRQKYDSMYYDNDDLVIFSMSEIKLVPQNNKSNTPYPSTPCAVSNPPIMAPAKPEVVTSWPVSHSPERGVCGRSPPAAVYLEGIWDKP